VRQADSLLRARRTEVAYDRFRAAVDADPRQFDGALGCARAALRLGRPSWAHYWLRYAERLEPGSHRVAHLRERLRRQLDERQPRRDCRGF